MCPGHTGVSKVKIHVPLLVFLPSLLTRIGSAFRTPGMLSISSASTNLNSSDRTTPFEEFKEMCGSTVTGSPQNVVHWRRQAESPAFLTWMSRLPVFRSTE